MVKTRRTVPNGSEEEEDSVGTRTYPTRSKELLGLRIFGKLGPDRAESKPEADCPLLEQLRSTREVTSKQLDRLRHLETALRPPQTLIPLGTLTDRDQLFLCQICSHAFDQKVRRPLCLPCGHTICKECTKMIAASNVRGLCPFDRRELPMDLSMLPGNQGILEHMVLRSRRTVLLCTTHTRPFVAFNPISGSLLCGSCLILQRDCPCFPLDSAQANTHRSVLYTRLLSLLTKATNYLALWKHVSQLLDIYSADPMDVYGSIYEHKQFAEVLGDIDDAVIDLSEIVEEIVNAMEGRMAQLAAVVTGWTALSTQEQFSVQLEDMYQPEAALPVLRLANLLLHIPLTYFPSV